MVDWLLFEENTHTQHRFFGDQLFTARLRHRFERDICIFLCALQMPAFNLEQTILNG